jgi:hypothetical protein
MRFRAFVRARRPERATEGSGSGRVRIVLNLRSACTLLRCAAELISPFTPCGVFPLRVAFLVS